MAAVVGELIAAGAVMLIRGTLNVSTIHISTRVATAGFEDVVRIQRINRRYAFDLDWRKPEPLVARRHTIGVAERIGPGGELIAELSDAELERVVAEVAELADGDEIDAVAIALLFSFVEPTHEIAIEQALRAARPELSVSRSSTVSPIWREYERTSTTLADAYVGPLMARYLEDLDAASSSCAWTSFRISLYQKSLW